jgi:hypothetical protein
MFGFMDLIHETVLNVDPARISTCQVSDQFLVGRRLLERILGHDVEETLGLGFEIR